MLHVFRTYQRYIYLVVTFVIIISFSFFGTYSTIVSNPTRDQIVFTAVDGTPVKRSELDEMVVFLSTDSEDKLIYGGAWGPNFLNDGVIKRDFMASGLATLLAQEYISELSEELNARHEKEKKYQFYVHPQAKFISSDAAWKFYAPGLSSSLAAFKKITSPTDKNAFATRIELYLSEKKFPAHFLRQALMMQEQKQSWVNHDYTLDQLDLSLFGHHTLEDWFGPRFVRLIAEFVINAAKVAQREGYQVSKEEALADLLHNAQVSYQQNARNSNIGVANSIEYYNEQLRRMGMDQNLAVKIWQQVLLSRRLFNDIGNAVLVDNLVMSNFQKHSRESIEGVVYELPKELHLSSSRSLGKLELYLAAVSKKNEDAAGSLKLPSEYLSATEVSKKYPELVQKRYQLQFTEANKQSLQAKISVRETWNWQVTEENWAKIKREFPELAVKKGDAREDRFQALDSLDDETRLRVDTFARTQIVEEHPEWLSEALDQARQQTLTVSLSAKGNHSIFEGLEDGQELVRFLDKAEVKTADKETVEPINFTADGRHYYRIVVLDRDTDTSILTFAEASREGILDELLDRELNSYYELNRDLNPDLYQNEDLSWKLFSDVEDKVLEQYFAKTLRAIEKDYRATNKSQTEKMTMSMLVPLRFYAYLNEAKTKMQKDPKAEEELTVQSKEETATAGLSKRSELNRQWKLIKKDARLERSTYGENKELFALEQGQWSQVVTAPNGNLSIFFAKQKGDVADVSQEKIQALQELLGAEAKANYMTHLVAEIKDKKAISFDYLSQPVEILEIPEQPRSSFAN